MLGVVRDRHLHHQGVAGITLISKVERKPGRNEENEEPQEIINTIANVLLIAFYQLRILAPLTKKGIEDESMGAASTRIFGMKRSNSFARSSSVEIPSDRLLEAPLSVEF